MPRLPSPAAPLSTPVIVGVSPEALATLVLFRSADDGKETELLLDQAGDIRARGAGSMPGGLAAPDAVAVQAEHIARTAAATADHTGHPH
jgi:hypothetical protein